MHGHSGGDGGIRGGVAVEASSVVWAHVLCGTCPMLYTLELYSTIDIVWSSSFDKYRGQICWLSQRRSYIYLEVNFYLV